MPRYLQKFASQVLLGVLNSSGVKRRAADLAMGFARRHARRRWEGAVHLADAALCPGFQRAPPEVLGLGVITCRPFLGQVAQSLMTLGLPLRTRKTMVDV